MDRDYSATAAPIPQTVRKETALEQLSGFGNRAEHVGVLIEGFLNRCKGSEADAPEGGNIRSGPSGHFGQMERLEKLLLRAEELALELGNVG